MLEDTGFDKYIILLSRTNQCLLIHLLINREITILTLVVSVVKIEAIILVLT